MLCHIAVIPSRQVQKVLANADLLRWSPELYSATQNAVGSGTADPEDHLLMAWLLVSDGQRLIVLHIVLDLRVTSETACTILANYDLGSHLGGFSFVDFIFSHEHAVLLQNVGIQASIISLTRPERHDISNIKYADSRGLAISPDSRCFSILTRSEGQDLVVVFTTTEMGTFKPSTFSPATFDAQGIKWCPHGDPLLCVWDSAAFGLKVSFFTANGHYMRHMDLHSESLGVASIVSNFEGLGVNTVDWLSCDGNAVPAVFNCSGQLFIERHTRFERVCLPIGPTIFSKRCLTTTSSVRLSLITLMSLTLRRILFGRRHKRATTFSCIARRFSSLGVLKGSLVLIRWP